MSPELAAAYHEAGHCLAIRHAFASSAPWLPMPAPAVPIRFVEITSRGGGTTAAKNVYSARWGIDVLKPEYRPLMEAQVVIELSGGVSEALLHGLRDRLEVTAFMESSVSNSTDLTRAEAVLRDIFRLTGYPVAPKHYADRAISMLLDNWSAVQALADALIEHRRLEGPEVLRIISRSR